MQWFDHDVIFHKIPGSLLGFQLRSIDATNDKVRWRTKTSFGYFLQNFECSPKMKTSVHADLPPVDGRRVVVHRSSLPALQVFFFNLYTRKRNLRIMAIILPQLAIFMLLRFLNVTGIPLVQTLDALLKNNVLDSRVFRKAKDFPH